VTGRFRTAAAEAAVRARYTAVLEGWTVPHQRLEVPTPAGPTFVLACGDPAAPPLVLLHGSLSNAGVWLPGATVWARHFRIYAPDTPGEPGFSAPAPLPFDGDAHGRWLEAVLDGLGLDRVALVGASYGGWMGLDFAVSRPRRVTKLALMSPAGIGRQRLVLHWLPLLMLGRWGRERARARVFGPPLPDPPAEQRAASALQQLIADSVRPRMMRIPRLGDAALRDLSMPVLVLLGGRDVLLDSGESRRRLAALLPRAEVHFDPAGAHVLPGKGPAILAFLLRAT
jgi:pimeloyl-ACP methyl ester carboxylesterase